MTQDFTYWQKREGEKTDWGYDKDWVRDYWESRVHPHRLFLLQQLGKLRFDTLLEVGCNAGPNLALIKERWPEVKVSGIEASLKAARFARDMIPQAEIIVGNLLWLPWPDKSFDVVLADAVLMYIKPEDVKLAFSELKRVAKRAIVVVDRYSKAEKNDGYIWSRDYKKILEDIGDVSEFKITKDIWPTSKGWQKSGRLYVCRLR